MTSLVAAEAPARAFRARAALTKKPEIPSTRPGERAPWVSASFAASLDGAAARLVLRLRARGAPGSSNPRVSPALDHPRLRGERGRRRPFVVDDGRPRSGFQFRCSVIWANALPTVAQIAAIGERRLRFQRDSWRRSGRPLCAPRKAQGVENFRCPSTINVNLASRSESVEG